MKESKNSNPLRIFDFTPQLMVVFPPTSCSVAEGFLQMKNKNMIFRLEEQLSDRLRTYAKATGNGISTVIRDALTEYLNWRQPDLRPSAAEQDAIDKERARKEAARQARLAKKRADEEAKRTDC